MSDQIASWLEDVRAFVHDDNDARHEFLNSRPSIYHSEVPAAWWTALKELDGRARLLDGRLKDCVLPALDERDPRRSALGELGEAVEGLRDATWNRWGDTDASEIYEHHVQRIDWMAHAEHVSGTVVSGRCPRCGVRMESAAAARQHFYSEHPSAEKVLKDPGKHMIEVDRAVGRCRVALREANRLAGAHEDADQSDESELKAPENVFREEGTMWFASFNGESDRFSRLKGCEDIALILEQGETGVSVITLASDVDTALNGASPSSGCEEGLSVAGAAQPTPERVPQKVWDEGLRDVEAKAEDAEARGDHEAAAEARKQHEKLSALRAEAYGLGGRERDNSAPAEKARQMVKARINRARKRIAKTMPHLAAHFERSIKSKGGTFTYCPESPTEWVTR